MKVLQIYFSSYAWEILLKKSDDTHKYLCFFRHLTNISYFSLSVYMSNHITYKIHIFFHFYLFFTRCPLAN